MRTLMTIAFTLFASTAVAEGSHSGDHGDTGMSMGTITKVDTQWNRLTIDHGPLDNVDMEAMTMVFEVADPEMIEELEEGQEVVFIADHLKGKLTVTEIMPE